MPAGNETSAPAREVVITRVFDAPRELVWRAWTDAEHFKRWWGPGHYTAPVAKFDLRVGGKFVWCMRSPEGQDFWSTGVFKELIEPERIVYTDSFADSDGNPVPASYYGMDADLPMERTIWVTLEGQDGKTLMTLRHAAAPSAEFSDMEQAGWNESFDKLAASLK
jgi:uncharacterized protein YndB with AHSA1/START domain